MNETTSPSPVRYRRLRILAASLPVLVAVVGLALAWLVGTESGLRTGASVIARATSDAVRLEGVSGRLISGFSIERVQLALPAVRGEARALNVQWDAAALLDERVRIMRLALGDLTLSLAPGEDSSAPPSRPAPLRLPVAVELDQFDIERFTLLPWQAGADSQSPAAGGEGALFSFSHLHAALHSDGRRHQLRQVRVSLPFGDVKADASIDSSTDDYPLMLALDLQGAVEGRSFDLELRAEGGLQRLAAELDARGEGLTGRARALLTPFEPVPLAELQLALGLVNPAAFAPQAPQAALTLEAQLAGTAVEGGAMGLAGTVGISNASPQPVDEGGIPLLRLDTRLDWRGDRLGLRELDVQLPGGGRAHGRLDWRADAEAGAFGRADVALQLEGVRLDALQSQLPAHVLAGTVDAQGAAARQSAQVMLTLGKAALKADGELRFDATGSTPPAFALGATLTGVDPSAFAPAAPAGALNLELSAKGALQASPSLTLDWRLLPSVLDERPMQGQGSLALAGERLVLNDTRLDAAGNTLLVRGAWGAVGDALQLSLDAPALDALGYGLGGRAKLDASLAGSLQDPALKFALDAAGLRLPGELRLERIVASGELGAGRSGALMLTLDADSVGQGQEAVSGAAADWLERLRVRLDGRRDQHRLALSLSLPRRGDGSADPDALEVALEGGLSGDVAKSGPAGLRWRGVLRELVSSGRFPARLLEPAALELGSERIALADATLDAGTRGKIRLEETRWTPQEIVARGDMSGLVVDLVPRDTPRRRPQQDPLTLAGEWDLRLGRSASGSARIVRESGDLRIPGELTTRLGVETLEAALQLERGEAQLTLVARGTEFGSLSASAAVGLMRGGPAGWQLDAAAPLRGDARLDAPSIAWLARLTQQEVALEGSLAADLTLAGTPAKPVASGRISGEGLGLTMLDHGVSLSGGTLLAEFDRDRLRLTRLEFVSPNRVMPADRRVPAERFTATPGRLLATGEVELETGAGRFRFDAERLPVLQLPDRWMIVSGSGEATSGWTALDLQAKFAVDAGFVALADTPPPSLSDDVVVLKPGAQASAGGMKVSADVEVALGEQLFLSALGLDTRLGGSLRLRMRDGEPLTATGSLATVGGVFKGYGQNLTIERGLVNFQGPLDNPGLNIVALRKGLAIEAGISVSGSARRPQVRLVSDPNVPDPEKLSWIVLGRAPTSGAGGDMGLLLPAAQALLGGSGGGMTEQLSQSLGFDEFGIGQGEMGSVTRRPTSRVVGGGSTVSDEGTVSGQVLTLGKRLSSDMFLSFEQSLGGAQSLVKLTYQLSRRVSLVLRGGTDNAGDVYYTVSFR